MPHFSAGKSDPTWAGNRPGPQANDTELSRTCICLGHPQAKQWRECSVNRLRRRSGLFFPDGSERCRKFLTRLRSSIIADCRQSVQIDRPGRGRFGHPAADNGVHRDTQQLPPEDRPGRRESNLVGEDVPGDGRRPEGDREGGVQQDPPVEECKCGCRKLAAAPRRRPR